MFTLAASENSRRASVISASTWIVGVLDVDRERAPVGVAQRVPRDA